MKYFLGIEVSTTATKALVLNEVGQVVAVDSSEYAYETPHPLYRDLYPALISSFQAVAQD